MLIQSVDPETGLKARQGFEPEPKPSPFGTPDYIPATDSPHHTPVLERLQ